VAVGLAVPAEVVQRVAQAEVPAHVAGLDAGQPVPGGALEVALVLGAREGQHEEADVGGRDLEPRAGREDDLADARGVQAEQRHGEARVAEGDVPEVVQVHGGVPVHREAGDRAAAAAQHEAHVRRDLDQLRGRAAVHDGAELDGLEPVVRHVHAQVERDGGGTEQVESVQVLGGHGVDLVDKRSIGTLAAVSELAWSSFELELRTLTAAPACR